ncbi:MULTISPECIES: hypothetical protein [unclassified Corynebacterium]|uniref:hypothetical protein n=1 Tax=unclassified Corynebacterium TaxID=2624378 RepID=UPI0029CA7D48|nr:MULTISPECIES: hypothetical protein [unclassified Corynebacterium]WPF66099.1 hypothetical protein OLX12_11225 [Corynebacterium sp. 22KM0430]WPF68591.1 hypothetical protein OLW90_11220 [Corynebacterium sp. 21KM1197]
MTPPARPEHPENNLHSDADYTNKLPPAPHSPEDLARATDPAVQHERNRASTRQALWWLGGTVVLSAVVCLVLALLARALGGPYCEAGEATWLCSRAAQVWWGVGSAVVPVAGLVGCMVIMVRKLQRYTRWRAWMGIFWVLVPHAMMWMTTTLPYAIVGNPAL